MAKHLLFHASLSVPSSSEPISVVVKLISEHYGDDGCPPLVGCLWSCTKASCSLRAWRRSKGLRHGISPTSILANTVWLSRTSFHVYINKDIIRRSLDRALDILAENGRVHGDLQSINIMVEVSGDGVILVEDASGNNRSNISVIDFE